MTLDKLQTLFPSATAGTWHQHVNPDGTTGGWVQNTATVAPSAYISGDALVFELSKVDRVDIRARAVSHLRNIDEDLAATVADGLGLDLPDAAKAAKPTLDLPTSSALSIVANGPANFAGRKMGLLLTDGASAPRVVIAAGQAL